MFADGIRQDHLQDWKTTEALVHKHKAIGLSLIKSCTGRKAQDEIRKEAWP